jgi:hypothetical protein
MLYQAYDRARFKLERIGWEISAIRWRRRYPLLPLSDNATVSFLIPIFAKNRAPDWDLVSANLSRTLRSLLRQTDPRWNAFICSQDRPHIAEEDPRIKFLQYPCSRHKLMDKEAKLRYMSRRLAPEKRDCYAFFLDGDDLVHPNLVEYFFSAKAPSGYYIPNGYSLDCSSGLMRLHSDSLEVNYPFTRVSGSSHAVRFDSRAGSAQVLHISHCGDHKITIDKARERFNLILSRVPFPAMIYLYNHGTSNEDLRGASAGNIRSLPNQAIRPLTEDERALVLDSFGLSSQDLEKLI